MKTGRLALLEAEPCSLEKASAHLGYSVARTQQLRDKPQWTPEELERFEEDAALYA